LHGSWTSEIEVSSSDLTMKENIRPLFETLDTGASRGLLRGNSLATSSGGAAVDSLMQMLRPVSYNYKSDAKEKVRFGFIADEVHEILPEVIRTDGSRDRMKGVVYQDIIAILVAQMQHMFKEMEEATSSLVSVEQRIQRRRAWKARRRARKSGAS